MCRKSWKKWICSILLCSLCIAPAVMATEGNPLKQAAEENFRRHVKAWYEQLDFSGGETLSYEVFSIACKGYWNLRGKEKLSKKHLLTIADMSLSSCSRRLWVIDMDQQLVLQNDYVAHGKGSGEEYAQTFSNRVNSHQTSLGFYVTGESYKGEHGKALKLHGMDQGFNHAAFTRAIVLHGADYVSEDFIRKEKRLGRSWGCPAVSRDISDALIEEIKDGSCLFIYYPQAQYFRSSVWLRQLPRLVPGPEIFREAPQSQSPLVARAAKEQQAAALRFPYILQWRL